ncbi:hypothetical protein [Sphingopyxis macrogoltabida]|uniref:hypothetical protein n=1 Tax=Sphingopyxis macrogoltabida TaxID=33050 RepID=UPI0011AB588B|nr:hypothetical protein [Sphingopyxis macrogoltabida]
MKARETNVREAADILQQGERWLLFGRADFHFDHLHPEVAFGRDREGKHIALADDFQDAIEDQWASLGFYDELGHP